MNSLRPFLLVIPITFLSFACSEDPTDSSGSGGQTMTGGSTSSGGTGAGGTAGSGGNGAGGSSGGQTPAGGTGGLSTGGVENTGGVESSGGSDAGGTAGSGGSGGTNAGGGSSGGTGGTGGSGGGGGTTATPSAGCGTASTGNGNVNDAIVTFPSDYDGTTPVPMIFGFHGAGRTNENFRTTDARTQGHALEDEYVIVYLKSDGNDWLAGSNAGKFSSAYDTMLENNCIDTSRVFAMGHSSGAQFITTLLCGGEDRFLGTAPVAGGIIGQCNSHPAIHQIYIHGKNDNQRGGNGQAAFDLVSGINGCGAPEPMEQPGCMSNGVSVDPGCTEYQDCSHRTVWCSHNDPNYSNTNHGWPCFANDAIKAFFDEL